MSGFLSGLKVRSVTGALLVTLTWAGVALADCIDAVDSYNSALAEINAQISRYTRCLSSSEGEDDCTSEFRRLRSAQGDFEGAVTNYRRECE